MRSTNLVNKIHNLSLLYKVCFILLFLTGCSKVEGSTSPNLSHEKQIERQSELQLKYADFELESTVLVGDTSYSVNYPKLESNVFNNRMKEFSLESIGNFIKLSNDGSSNDMVIDFDVYEDGDKYFSIKYYTRSIVNDTYSEVVKGFTFDKEQEKFIDTDDIFYGDYIEPLITVLSSKINTDTTPLFPTKSYLGDLLLKDGSLIFVLENDLMKSDTLHNVPVHISEIKTALNPDFVLDMLNVDETIKSTYEIPNTDINKSTTTSDNSERKKYIALTYDDGPNPHTTMELLALLDRYNAKATFYVLGDLIESNSEIVEEIYKRGHELGNHSYNHKFYSTLNQRNYDEQYTTTDSEIEKVLGIVPNTIRRPYGVTESSVGDFVTKPFVNWSIDTEDWSNKDANEIFRIFKEQVHNGGIVLMHDIYMSSIEGSEKILNWLQDNNYETLTVSELLSLREEPAENGITYYGVQLD